MTTTSKKSVTITSLAIAAMITTTAGVVHGVPSSDPIWNAPAKITRAHSAPIFAMDQQPSFGLGTAEASRIVPCLMPPTWRRDCEP
jgi:hypothetical protein